MTPASVARLHSTITAAPFSSSSSESIRPLWTGPVLYSLASYLEPAPARPSCA